MKFYIFASGSKGNSTLLVDKSVRILIDFGISKSQLENHLKSLNLSIADLDFILLTHEHVDHIKGLENINNINILGSKNTFYASKYKNIEPYHPFKCKHLTITPIQTSHDAQNPLGFIFNNEFEKLVYITDTGYISENNMELAKNANYYIIESNHNRKMLIKTHRPSFVKERIMSEFGHLSNEDCALYLANMIGEKTSQIFLAHISLEANTYDLAKETCVNYLIKKGINLSNIKIISARQYEMVKGGQYEN